MKNIFKRVISAILTAATVVSVFVGAGSVFAAETEASYKQSLIKKGFPESYVDDLYKLHKKYPSWEFTPLDVTKKSNGKYTWDYCVYMETEDQARRSLVGKTYKQYFDWGDPTMYDTGWYKASVYAVEYYMDPRNFMDEKQIFQFLDLSYNSAVTVAAVENVCKNTFMAKDSTSGAKLDHPTIKTYAEYFKWVGEKVNLNPVYIAACIKNEHGAAGTDSMINGKCGDKLLGYWNNQTQTEMTDGVERLVATPSTLPSGYTNPNQLLNLNGHYNYFNLGAAGTGRFTVYFNGMTEAMKGTEELKNEQYWNGDPAWNKHFKAIYGGAYKAAGSYMANKQNNFYLQKFNVNPDSKNNFWYQYMQNIMASESRTASLYNAYKNGGILNGAYEFVIPVFQGMPNEKCDNLDPSQIMDRTYLSEANMQAKGFKINGKDVKIDTVTTLDLSKYIGQNGVKAKYNSTITWPTYNGTKGSTLNLGKINLSKYDYALIEYSTKAGFKWQKNGYDSIIGFVSDPSKPYGGDKGKPNTAANIANGKMNDTKTFGNNGGYEYRGVAKVDLKTKYNGNVYLTAYTQPGFDYLVHNIVFVTAVGHTGTVADGGSTGTETKPVVTTAPVTTAPITDDITTAVGDVTTSGETVGNDTTIAETGDVTDNDTTVNDVTEPIATSPSEDSTLGETASPSEDITKVPDTTSANGEGDSPSTAIIIIVCAVVAVAAIGGGAVFFLKKKKSA